MREPATKKHIEKMTEQSEVTTKTLANLQKSVDVETKRLFIPNDITEKNLDKLYDDLYKAFELNDEEKSLDIQNRILELTEGQD